MSDNYILEPYRQLRTSQDKQIYFMLATAASAIAYALNRAEDRGLSLILIPWGCSLLFWGFSFYFGCRHLAYVSSTLFANIELLKIQGGEHPKVGNNSEIIQAASEGIRSAIEYNSNQANLLGKLQFWFFITGVFSYIIWQLLEMYTLMI